MNQIIKSLRFTPLLNASKNIFITTMPMRNFASICAIRSKELETTSFLKPQISSFNAIKHSHSKGERELVEFLAEEIVAEQKAQKVKKLPTDLEGFAISTDGAEVELKKDFGSDKVTIKFNVNHTVDSEENEMPSQEEGEFAEMKSKPTFEVDVKKDNVTLSFTCSYLQGEAQEGEYNDVFGIDEITIYEGAHSEKVYAVAGDVLDGYLYDLLMNYLEEKGISNAFAEKLMDFSTAYEHSNYIKFLDALSKFTVKSK